MKKIGLGIILSIIVLLTAGCGSEKELTCTLKQATSEFALTSTYKVRHSNGIVLKVDSLEEVTSSNEEILTNFEKTVKETYDDMNKKYGGYNFEVTNKDGKVTSKTLIDYSKLNLAKLKEDETSMAKYMNSKNQLTLKGIQTIYEAQGAVCK